MSKNVGRRNPLHLFVCRLEWRSKRNLAAYQELVAALDDRTAKFAILRKCCCTEAHHALR